MRASYHTHTYRCKHARGSEEEYIERAIAEGLTILGFADHAPMPYEKGFVSTYKMLPEEIGDYFSALLSLKEKYKNKIDIKIGFETEYYPSLWEKCLEFWRPYPLDYLILGQHFAPEEAIRSSTYIGWDSPDSKRLVAYTDCVIKAMNTGIITYVAHPDLINYTGKDKELLRSERIRLINEAVRLGIPLEYNLLGMSEGRAYPTDEFWHLASELGASVILGCDSHAPERVAKKSEIEYATRYLSRLGFSVLDEIELKPVRL